MLTRRTFVGALGATSLGSGLVHILTNATAQEPGCCGAPQTLDPADRTVANFRLPEAPHIGGLNGIDICIEAVDPFQNSVAKLKPYRDITLVPAREPRTFPEMRPDRYVQDGICGRDNRLDGAVLGTPYYPWSCVCMLIIHYPGYTTGGTGFLIGKRCILTAGHCVYDGRDKWPTKIDIYPGYKGVDYEPPFGVYESDHFVASEGWINGQRMDYDIGAVILPDDDLFNKVRGHFGVATWKGEFDRYLVETIGYPFDDVKRRPYYQDDDNYLMKGSTDKLWHHSLDLTGGQSGSPVFAYGEYWTPYVVGVANASGCGSGYNYNVAVRMTSGRCNVIDGWREL